MELQILQESFTVCQLASAADADLSAAYCFFAKTDEELSFVCPTNHVPRNTLRREDGWRAFRVAGTLDFSLVGILAGIADTLAKANVSLFAVSTFNTDYVLVKEAAFLQAIDALQCAGYAIAK